MTVSSSTSKSGPYSGDGSTTAFSFNFKVQAATDIKVVRTVTTNGTAVDTTLTVTADYTVSVNADQDTSPGGSITMISAPSSGQQITILRDVSATQGASFPNQGGFYPKVLETALDKLTMLYQQLREELSRALKTSVADSITNLQDLLLELNTAVANAESSESGASGSATTATAQAAIATAQATTATAQAGIATAQATAATAAAASIGFKDVVFISAANSPYTVTQATSGVLINVDTSSGSVVINLPTIATLSLPFTVGAKKATSDANTVTINRGGTDTFDDGTTSMSLAAVSGVTLVPDTDPSPDEWTAVAWGGTSLAQANTWTGVQTFRDNKFEITDDSDTTKKVNFQVAGVSPGTTRTLSVPDESVTLAGRAGNTFTGAQNLAKGPDVASAATTMDIWSTAQGNVMTVTGTVATSGLPAAPQAGASRTLIAAGAWPLVHGANFSVPGSTNYTCAAGDMVEVTAVTTTQFRLKITKADGTAVVAGPSGAATVLDVKTATAGVTTSLTFTTGIGSAYDVYELDLKNLTPGSAAELLLEFSRDGGATYDTGTSFYYSDLLMVSSSSVTGSSSSVDSISLTGYSVSTTASDGGVVGIVRIFSPTDSTTNKQVTFDVRYARSGASTYKVNGGAHRQSSTAAINAFRLRFGTGGATFSGKVILTGRKNTT